MENSITKISKEYDKHPVVRSLLQLLPGWGTADTLLQKRIEEIHADRLRTFMDELSTGEVLLTDEIIQSENFLHNFFCTFRAAINTRQREKIRLFARLLKGSINYKRETINDEYQELLDSLESLSLREFLTLKKLHELEKLPVDESLNLLQKVSSYWPLFIKESCETHSIPEVSFYAFMAKLERTGLYVRITGSYLEYDGDNGHTSPLFDRLLQFLQDSLQTHPD